MSEQLDGSRLATLSLFAGCDPAELEGVASRLQLRHLDAGEVLMGEGEHGDVFALLLEGSVSITRSSRSGQLHLADAGAGSIVGELAVLRHQPRSATVTATEPSVAATGTHAELAEILELREVSQRVRLLASSRLAHNLRPVHTTLQSGIDIALRPLLPEDREAFNVAVHQLSRDFLRRRFFSVGTPSEGMIDYLVHVDFVDHFAWLALDRAHPDEGIAVGRYIRSSTPSVAEVAFGVTDALQGRGLGTLLLGAVAVAALEAGIRTLVAHVLDDNKAMRTVFAKASPRVAFSEPGVVEVTIDARIAAGILEPGLRDSLAAATHDVVTAASLALTR